MRNVFLQGENCIEEKQSTCIKYEKSIHKLTTESDDLIEDISGYALPVSFRVTISSVNWKYEAFILVKSFRQLRNNEWFVWWWNFKMMKTFNNLLFPFALSFILKKKNNWKGLYSAFFLHFKFLQVFQFFPNSAK